jgi:RNA polymerase sigma-70 factor (ECF subfamily)
MAIVRCPARAEDAVHEAFVRLWSARERGDIEDAVAYAYAAVRRAAIDQVRRAATPPRCQRLHRDDLQPDQRLIAGETAELLRAGLDELPEDQREAVVMRIYGGLSFEAMARALRVPLPTAASRYRRALQRLRLTIDDHGGPHGRD